MAHEDDFNGSSEDDYIEIESEEEVEREERYYRRVSLEPPEPWPEPGAIDESESDDT